jgi:hypothetical protein
MNIIKSIMLLAALTTLAGCSTRLGQFTAASSMNVRNLDYSIQDSSLAKTEGDSCIHHVLFFPIGSIDDRIQRAMDDAIQNGRAKGLDGDLLVNVRINHRAWWALLYGQDCIEIEGDLVSIATDKKVAAE